ncbi:MULTISPECIES: hypothetical protein [Bacillus]|nr:MULTISPECIES: hypothetical protein [Bacillus]WFA07547.1 hypothetical protein P3X63_17810 [Bacillus sp. HSf4]
MTGGEFVALKVIAQIYEYLDCPIEEIVQLNA